MVESDGSTGKVEKALESKGAGVFELHLYVADMDSKSVEAIKNLKNICEDNIPGRYQLNIIDILANPALARENQIIAVPTLIKETPRPLKRLVGNMSNTERVLTGLGLCSKIS